jgi:GNAT superfamily N-acetyltransferase
MPPSEPSTNPPAGPPAIGSAGALADAELIALFNRVYADYFVTVVLDEAAWRRLVIPFDIDLEASRVAAEGAGIALLGVRGSRGWVGGMGVAPEARRRGTGRALMRGLIEQARRRSVDEIVLEVLEQNAPAIALYESLGFRAFRTLDVWTLQALPEPAGARAIDGDEAMRWIAARRTAPEPWQRASESVRRFVEPDRPLRGLEVRTGGRRIGAAVGLVVGPRASLLQLAVEDERPVEAARALCAAARAWASSLRFLNLPSDTPAATALRDLGGILEARQLEMSLATHAGSGKDDAPGRRS